MGDLLPMRPSERTGPVTTEPLWRELVGAVLREQRHERGEKLSETAGRAGISTQYLSEIERGRKDPSSELLSAVSGALDLSMRDLTIGVARRLHVRGDSPDRTGRVAGRPRGPLALAA